MTSRACRRTVATMQRRDQPALSTLPERTSRPRNAEARENHGSGSARLETRSVASARLFLLVLVLLPRVGPLAWAAEPPAADLRLEWLANGRVSSSPEPVGGRAGEKVVVTYRIQNVGSSDAFAVVLTALSALGAVAPAQRLQPGPAASRSVDRSLEVRLAEGMRELCIEASLQNRDAGDPPDRNPRDNRICRQLIVEASGSSALRFSVDRVANQRRNHHASPALPSS